MEKYYLEKIPPYKYKTSNLIYKVGYCFNSLHFFLQSDFTIIIVSVKI